MSENKIPIPSRIYNAAVGGHVAGTEDIIDDNKNKTQQEINTETDNRIQNLESTVGEGGSIDERIATAKSEIKGSATSACDTLGEAEALISAEKTRAEAAEADRYTKSETYTKEEVNSLITTPDQDFVSVEATAQTTSVTDVLPITGETDTIYRVGNWDGTEYNDSVFSEYAWNGIGYVKLSVKSQVGEVYDISANHADTKYADLAAALGTDGDNIPPTLRRGGMSIRYVQNSDNKYVQYFLTNDIFSTDVNDWDKNNELLDSYIVEGNIINNKYVSYQNGAVAEISNDDFFINKEKIQIPTKFRWYAGNNSDFSESPKPQMIAYSVDGSTYVDFYNFYAEDTDERGDVYQLVSVSRNYRITASFKKGGVCKITDNDGNVIWEPTRDNSVKYISSEVVRDPVSKKTIQSQIDDILENNGINSNKTKLFIGNIVSGVPSANATIAPSSTYACMQTLTDVPFMRATLKFHLPTGIIAGVRSGNCGVNSNTSQVNLTENIEDGDSFTFGDDDMLFRLFFKHSDGSNITAQEINTYIGNGSLYVTFNELCPILTAQADCDKYAKALMFKFHPSGSDKNKNYLGNIPVFAHISDIHGDSTRLERFMQYCDSLPIAAALNTGDSCSQNFNNGLKFVEEIALLHKTLLYTCIGNHDGYNNTTEQGQYENIMSYQNAERYGVTWSNETYPTSFYKDFPDVKIRLISLNQWTKGAGDSPFFENMSQAQINMLISALRDCPENYGIIIMSHNTEGGITKVQDYDKFYQYPNYGVSSICMTNANAEQTHPITDIIDAFIAKTTINKQYIANTSPQVTLTVNVDFSNSYGEFIFWACGHNHQDFVGYNSVSTQRQLILDITTACAIYGREVEDNDTCQDGDLPRGGNGATQDCFNIYAIDMENGVVKIARIGSNVNYKMEVRDYMSIPYKV